MGLASIPAVVGSLGSVGFRGLVVSLSESSSDRTNSSEPAAFALSFFFVDPLLRGGSSLTFGGGDGGGEGEDEDNSSGGAFQSATGLPSQKLATAFLRGK